MTIKYFGDKEYRGECPRETAEHLTFVSYIHNHYPCLPLVHIKNEGARTWRQAKFDKSMGSLRKGASDIIILHKVPFVMEIKRKDLSRSVVSDDQIEFLNNCDSLGCFTCIALGHQAAIAAFNEWRGLYYV